MPRDINGTYSRVNPPGATGYVNNTTISETQVNGEINDIGNEITKSLAKDGTTLPTTNLPMNNFVHTGLGLADAAGETLRFNALQKGSDIAVTASGSQTIPAEGSMFNLTAASAFNITAFANTYNGRTFTIRSNADKLLKLVNSASLVLVGGVDRIMASGESVMFYQFNTGVYVEIGAQPVIDMTGYSGADLPLAIGQTAKYTLSAATSLLLRIATGTDHVYQIDYYSNNFTGTTLADNPRLEVNNVSLGASTCRNINFSIFTTNSVQTPLTNDPYFIIGNLGRAHNYSITVFTRTAGKRIRSEYYTTSSVNDAYGVYGNSCTDTTTAWTSLGEIVFQDTVTGMVTVTRKL